MSKLQITLLSILHTKQEKPRKREKRIYEEK